MLLSFNDLFSVSAQTPQDDIHPIFSHTIGINRGEDESLKGPGFYFMFRKKKKSFRLIYVGKHDFTNKGKLTGFHKDRVSQHLATITFKVHHSISLAKGKVENATTPGEIDAAFLDKYTFEGCEKNDLWKYVRKNILQLPHRVGARFPPTNTFLGKRLARPGIDHVKGYHVKGSPTETSRRRFQYACLYWNEVESLSTPKQLQDYLDKHYSFLWLPQDFKGPAQSRKKALKYGEEGLIEKYRSVVNNEMGYKKNCPKEVKSMMSSSKDVNLWANEELLLKEIPKFWAILKRAEERAREWAGVLAAVKNTGYALQHASEELKAVKDVVMAAVKKDGGALEYASEDLKADKKVVMAAVKKDGGALEYASEDLKADKKVVMAAVKKDGGALEYASDELKTDPKIRALIDD